ncbi:L-aspartate oxidase [Henriciella sp.]|uniref:L-aspartate oxidase n=1 Tax=Henriciella sp. TaxID=1968823 RepID=UPI00260C82BC|nr:L-aspartate oxidase [Henriciella sp.]
MSEQTRITATASAGESEILIVGAGLAGLFLALRLAPRPVTIIAPAPLGEAASSAWAQGGLAAALDPLDSPETHAQDTIAAGAGLVDPVIARLIAEEGPARVLDLIALGVPFDRTEEGALALSLEAAHSHPRVARVAGDLAGKAIMGALTAAVQDAGHITMKWPYRAVSLLQQDNGSVAGIIAQDRHGNLAPMTARHTILCTGGSGGLFRVTTNPPQSRGEAVAMAHACGALVADPEFVQFHPTAMDVGLDPAPLATEALRGEGAIMRNGQGTPFMAHYHEKAELAPRDEVARAIHSELEAGNGAFLDATLAVGNEFPARFPTVFAACMAAGIDPRTKPIPVAPAAHYHMGGVVADAWGRSTLDHLSICGECASTGAHGGNRLASNSLLEAVVFAARIAERLQGTELHATGPSEAHVADDLPADALYSLRLSMAAKCGVVREAAGLTSLLNEIDELEDRHGTARALVTARLMAEAALAREESRGGHFRSDFPESRPDARRTFKTGPVRQPQRKAAE